MVSKDLKLSCFLLGCIGGGEGREGAIGLLNEGGGEGGGATGFLFSS